MKAPGSYLFNLFRWVIGLSLAAPLWAINEYGSISNYSEHSAQGIPYSPSQQLPNGGQYSLLQSALEFQGKPLESTYHRPLPYQMQAPQLPVYTEEQKQILLEDAMRAAWNQYGPKNKQRIASIVTSPSQYTHRDTSSGVPLTGFQPSFSEWDQHVTKLSAQPFPPPQPNFFTQFLSAYIDFEVNYHEAADIIRRVVALIFIGLLIVAWISLGSFLGLFTMKGIFGVGRTQNSDDVLKRMDVLGNDGFTDMAGRVHVALEGDWLRKLHDKIEKQLAKNSTETFVQCCILPDQKSTDKANGVAECRIVKRAELKLRFHCSTNLTYNFEFGPNHNQISDVKKFKRKTMY